jgi:hypothetical protein
MSLKTKKKKIGVNGMAFVVSFLTNNIKINNNNNNNKKLKHKNTPKNLKNTKTSFTFISYYNT